MLKTMGPADELFSCTDLIKKDLNLNVDFIN